MPTDAVMAYRCGCRIDVDVVMKMKSQSLQHSILRWRFPFLS